MIEKLQIIQQRFDEVSDLIIQPDIISDQKRYVQLNKEYKDLSVMIEKIDAYKIILSNLEEAELILKEEDDEEDTIEDEMVELSKNHATSQMAESVSGRGDRSIIVHPQGKQAQMPSMNQSLQIVNDDA